MKREEVIKNLKISGQPEHLLDELEKFINNPMKVKIRSEPVLPNFIVLRRGKTNGIDLYWINDFKHFIEKWKSWDKDFIIII